MTGAPPTPVRWAVLGASRIAAAQLIPAVREAGGQVRVVAARNPDRARAYAADHDIDDAVAGYRAALERPDIDVVYVSLPHHLHAEWAAAALRAGKAVLCEKPLTVDVPSTAGLLDVARETGGLLWESFVFPFHPVTPLARSLVEDLGGLREIWSRFDFEMTNPDDFRWDPDAGGGALNDVGCYPIRLGRLLTGAEPVGAAGSSVRSERGVDVDTSADLDFPSGVVLHLECSVRRPFDGSSTIRCADGRVEIPYVFHPADGDALTVTRSDGTTTVVPVPAGRAFTFAATHIQDAVRGMVAPEHLAVDDALGQARALALTREATA